VPLDFLKRRPGAAASAPSAEPIPEEASAQDYGLKLTYTAKSSEGVRMREHPDPMRELPEMVAGLATTPLELIPPLPLEYGNASPIIQRVDEAAAWLNAHRELSPIARHSLVVFETVDALDLAFDTLVVSLLHGDVDTSGYPEYNAIVGGVASHWDESTGDLIVRGLVGWGGRGVRGDTDRVGTKLLTQLVRNALGSQHAVGMTHIERPMPAAGRGGLVCAHCGFASAHDRTFYCPKCGMRMLRG
jgi:hypothetical protein